MCIRVFIVAFLIILLGAGAVAVAIATGVFKSPEVVSSSSSWGEVSEDSTTVVTDLVIDNSNPVGLAVGRVSVVVEIKFNDVVVGQAESEGIDLRRGESSNRVVTAIDNTEIPDWWASHIASGEHTRWTLDIKLETSIFGRTVTVPLTNESGMFSTHIIEQINAYRPDPIEFAGYSLGIAATDFEWSDVSDEQSTLTGTIRVQNDTPVSVQVPAADYALTLNGVTVGSGQSAPDIQLSSNATTDIPLSFTVDHARMQEWWPTHIMNGERSTAEVEIGLTLGGNLPAPIGLLQFRTPVVTVSDTLQTDLLARTEVQEDQE